MLKNNEIIEGIPEFDLDEFLSDIADSGIIVPLLQTFTDALVSAEKTSTEIRYFFSDSRSVLKDNKLDIKQTTKEFSHSAKIINTIATKLDNSLTEEKINETADNIYNSSDNISKATQKIKDVAERIDCSTQNINKTMTNLDSILYKTNDIASSAKVMTNGLCKSMGKRFAGLRLLFGKPLDGCKCTKKCPK